MLCVVSLLSLPGMKGFSLLHRVLGLSRYGRSCSLSRVQACGEGWPFGNPGTGSPSLRVLCSCNQGGPAGRSLAQKSQRNERKNLCLFFRLSLPQPQAGHLLCLLTSIPALPIFDLETPGYIHYYTSDNISDLI